MPGPSKGARLYLRDAGTKNARWIIRDGSKSLRTGFGPRDREAAEQRLADYIAAKYQPSRTRGRDPAQIPIADVIAIYLSEVAPRTARPKATAQRAVKLLEWWGERTLADISGVQCRAYAEHRGSASAARRELEDLRAAIIHHRREGLCEKIVDVVLPERSLPRERWLTRSEAARLLWAAWRGGQGKRRHVARFILVALYTGTRAGAVCGAAMRPTVGRGYVDLEEGVFYRRATGKRETNKRQPPIRLPARLLVHLRRWERLGICQASVVEWHCRPVERVSKGFRNAARDAGLEGVSPHVLRHTAVTWAMQGGADLWEAAGFFGMTVAILERVYGHQRPDHGRGIASAMNRRG